MSIGYIPPVPRLKLPARRGNPWVRAPWADSGSIDTASGRRRGRRGVVLDLDDTLYPRARFVMSGFAAVAHHLEAAHGVEAQRAYGVLLRAHQAGDHRGRELQLLCERLGLAADLVPGLIDLFRRHLPTLWLNHDVVDALHTLRVNGWRLAILTNGLPSVQFRKVAALGLTSLVDEVIYAEEHAAGGKPSIAAFRAALQALDLRADHCVCVGDDVERDIRGARAAGLRTIRVARPDAAPAADEDADLVIDGVRQLPDVAAMLLDRVTADVA
jgi:putative hydrolase of the HAD superfamily